MADKKATAWILEERFQDGERVTQTITDRGYLLKEIESSLNNGAAYISVSALYPLFGSSDTSSGHNK